MNNTTAPWVRIFILLISVGVILLLAYTFTGKILPDDAKSALIFQNALLLIVLGSALTEHHFTKPADSLINSLMALITLISVYSISPKTPWFCITSYCLIVFILSLTCITVSSTQITQSSLKQKISKLTYRPSVVLGKSRLIFSIVFLSGLWFFYSVQDQITLALVIFWGAFLAMWPLKIPELITSWFSKESPSGTETGKIIRIDSPNIVRAQLDPRNPWDYKKTMVCGLPNGKAYWLQPLFSQFNDGKLLATGLLTQIEYSGDTLSENHVFAPELNVDAPSEEEINNELGGGAEAKLVGFVIENSSISSIRFETLDPKCCYEGMLVWATVNNSRVYYQIVEGLTSEETFTADRHGFQIATATQLGTIDPDAGFEKYEWLPAMNTPIFCLANGKSLNVNHLKKSDFKLGQIPNSNIDIGGDFAKNFNYHTALLGVTGSGKTELAFDLIRHALQNDIKVICIDLTAQYENRLNDLKPINLSIDEKTALELSNKLFDVETGTYGAPNEKKALNTFAATLREQISKSIASFMSDKNNSKLGLIKLEELSNTKATLWITELYMTCLLKFARDNIGNCPKTLIVVEEAHTVMPEPSSMGLGDYDSRGLVGKIGQIALQGRKYGVGLLVLAQRTATVSKTILTQCNTIISFTCYDDTSLGFLKNIYGQDHIALIPNLPPRHAVAFGKWIKSEKPIVFEIPYDAAKAENGM